MSTDKELEFLATIIDQCCDCCEPKFELPYTHDELIEILSRVRNGHILNLQEYEAFKLLLFNKDDGEDNTEGDVLFTGDYLDLKNKPFIPLNMTQLQDYEVIMRALNKRMDELSARDSELEESIDNNARFVSAIEVVLMDEIEKLTKLVEACKLFEGDSLEDVIAAIQGELAGLERLREDLDKGMVLSERVFTEEYNQILDSISNNPEGLAGYIKNVIADSIVDPGQPNNSSNMRLDSIGEALATKVDKDGDKVLSTYDFDDTYKNLLDPVLQMEPSTQRSLVGYIKNVVNVYEDEFDSTISAAVSQMNAYTKEAVQEMKEEVGGIKNEVTKQLNEATSVIKDGAQFKEGDGPTSITIGGLEKGTELEGKTVREILLKMVCPFIYPSVSAELILSFPNQLYEIGDTVEVQGIRAFIEKGSLPINRVVFKQKTGNVYKILKAYAGNVTEHKFLDSDIMEITHSIDSDYFVVDVEDTDGNKVSCDVGTIDFVYPVFYGAFGSETTMSETNIRYLYKVLKYYGDECLFTYTTNNERIVLAIPEIYGLVSDIVDQNGYIITNSFETRIVNLHFETREKVGNDYQINKYTMPYRVYYSSPNTVNGFEVTFKF